MTGIQPADQRHHHHLTHARLGRHERTQSRAKRAARAHARLETAASQISRYGHARGPSTGAEGDDHDDGCCLPITASDNVQRTDGFTDERLR